MVCARCSDYKAELQYDGNRLNRVCQECYVFLMGHMVLEDREGKHKGILEVSFAHLCLSSPRPCSSVPLSRGSATRPGPQPRSHSLAVPLQQEGCESEVPANGEAGGCAKLPPSCLGTSRRGSLHHSISQPGPPVSCPWFGGVCWVGRE